MGQPQDLEVTRPGKGSHCGRVACQALKFENLSLKRHEGFPLVPTVDIGLRTTAAGFTIRNI
jgi:hypothetical protein